MRHGPTLPIKLDSASNGEYAPVPVSPGIALVREIAAARITANARRTGVRRRDFMTSLCGAATTLLALDEHAGGRARGGAFVLPHEAAFEPEAAAVAIGGDDFIFDIQTHMIDPAGAGRRTAAPALVGLVEKLRAAVGLPPRKCDAADELVCYDAEHLVKEVFLDSDTDMAVLSFAPAWPVESLVSMQEAARVRELVAALGHGRRLLLHAMVVPNAPCLDEQLARMEQVHREYGISAWKVYPQWAPPGRTGFWLDDPEIFVPVIEQARRLGVKIICAHKGLPFPGHDPRYAACHDVGRVARMYPDVTFIVYHSGFDLSRREGPYDPCAADRGTNSLVQSLLDNGIGPDQNVYAELGSTWRMLMREPTQAAHTLGKLLRYVGERRVLWGTDSIWYGSPQDQIQAFRAFQIGHKLQELHEYPALTREIKSGVFGLSAAAVYGVDPAEIRRTAQVDPLGKLKAIYREDPQPSFATYGPRNAAEWRRYLARKGDDRP